MFSARYSGWFSIQIKVCFPIQQKQNKKYLPLLPYLHESSFSSCEQKQIFKRRRIRMERPLSHRCVFQGAFQWGVDGSSASSRARIPLTILSVIWMNNCEASLCILMTCVGSNYKIEMEIGWRVYLTCLLLKYCGWLDVSLVSGNDGSR